MRDVRDVGPEGRRPRDAARSSASADVRRGSSPRRGVRRLRRDPRRRGSGRRRPSRLDRDGRSAVWARRGGAWRPLSLLHGPRPSCAKPRGRRLGRGSRLDRGPCGVGPRGGRVDLSETFAGPGSHFTTKARRARATAPPGEPFSTGWAAPRPVLTALPPRLRRAKGAAFGEAVAPWDLVAARPALNRPFARCSIGDPRGARGLRLDAGGFRYVFVSATAPLDATEDSPDPGDFRSQALGALGAGGGAPRGGGGGPRRRRAGRLPSSSGRKTPRTSGVSPRCAASGRCRSWRFVPRCAATTCSSSSTRPPPFRSRQDALWRRHDLPMGRPASQPAGVQRRRRVQPAAFRGPRHSFRQDDHQHLSDQTRHPRGSMRDRAHDSFFRLRPGRRREGFGPPSTT